MTARRNPNEPDLDAGRWADIGYLSTLELGPEAQVPANGHRPHSLPPDLDLDELLDDDEPDHEWVVPGLIERGDRWVLTGPEGGGKTTLLRQVGVQLGSGIHPFTLEEIDPLSVLIVDCENSRRQTRRALRPLRQAAGDRYRPGTVRVVPIGGSIQVAAPDVEADLVARIQRHRVDLLLIGPLYKMAIGDPIKEEPARLLADSLDRIRAVRGSALFIEAHTPYAEGTRSRRPKRPYGASLWSRWPEFGIHLDPTGALEHWRGQREERNWPTRLTRAEPWPWAKTDAPASEKWSGPTECMAAIVALFEEHDPDGELSKRKVADRLRGLGLSYRDGTVRSSLEELASEGRLLVREGPRRAQLYRLSKRGEQPDELF